MSKIQNRMLESQVVTNCESDSETDFLSASVGKLLDNKKLDTELKSYTLIIDDTNGNDSTADGTLSKPFKTIMAAYNYLPDFVNTVNLKIKEGTYDEGSTIQLYKNIINLNISSYDENNTVVISAEQSNTRDSLIYISNSHKVTINNISFTRNENLISGNCITIDCTSFDITNCNFEDSYIAVKTSCSNGQIDSCTFKNLYCAINANKASNILSTNNESVSNVQYGIICNGSIVINYGEDLEGTTDDYITTLYGRVFMTETEVAVASIVNNSGEITSIGNTDTE